jgi:hypothetical protein
MPPLPLSRLHWSKQPSHDDSSKVHGVGPAIASGSLGGGDVHPASTVGAGGRLASGSALGGGALVVLEDEQAKGSAPRKNSARTRRIIRP